MKYGYLHDGLEYWRRAAPDKAAAVMDQTETLTYGDLGRWSDGVAERLTNGGVAPGDRVIVIGANSLTFIAAAFGVFKAGAVVVPLNDRFKPRELAYFIGFSEAAAVIADAPRHEMIAALGLDVPLIDFAAVALLRGGASSPGWRAPSPPADALAMIIFTSGSTGTPKGVMLAHGEQLGRYFDMTLYNPELGPETRSMVTGGLAAAPGTAWGYTFATSIGGTVYFNSKYTPEKTLSTLVNQRITFVNAVPLIYKEMSKIPGFDGSDFSSLRFARCGGARLPRDVWDAWAANGVTIRTLYGQSEIGGGAIIATNEEARAKPESCGRGTPLTKIRIVRPDGSECGSDEPGAVLIQGPGMMAGYWKNPEESELAIIDGWLHTGDIGVKDADGDFFFVDRAKELVKCGGFNVSPQEIENTLLEIDAIDECAIFAVPDERYVEVPFALIFAKREVSKREIFDYCKERLANFKLPRYIEFAEAPLPRLPRGKIDKHLLKTSFADAPARFSKLS